MASYKKDSIKMIYLCLDVLSMILAAFTSIWLRFLSSLFSEKEGLSYLSLYYRAFLIAIPVYVIIYILFNLYKDTIEIDFYKEVSKIISSNLVAALVFTALLFILKGSAMYSRWALVFFILFNTFFCILFRALYRFIYMQSFKKGRQYSILVLGTGRLAELYVNMAKQYQRFGYHIIGFITPEKNAAGCRIDKSKILGTFQDFHALLAKYHFDEVVVALHIQESQYIDKIIKLCDREGVRIKIIPGYYEHLKYSTYIEDFNGLPMLTVRGVPLDSSMNRFLKRSFDILFSLFAILIASPVMLVTAVMVKRSSTDGKILFRQKRVGLNNNEFIMYKFKSMRDLPPEEEKKQWSREDDPRITRLGAFLRKTSIDELPQFFNVLKGDMSVVGPRPERPYWVEQFKEDIPQYMLRHYVKSGITGWAQVNGLRGDTSIEERVKYDNYYIQNWSLVLDIRIIFKTVFGH